MAHYLDRAAGWMPPQLAGIYDETSFWSAHFGALLFEHLEIRRGVRGLDVGCATGFPLFELAQVHGPSSRFTGIDVWQEALARARFKLAEYRLPNVEIVEADAAAMPFASGRFDLIVSNLGVNNFEDAPAALRECRRVAKSNARLVLTTNVEGHFREFYLLMFTLLAELGLSEVIPALRKNEEHRRSKDAIAALLAPCGFEVSRAIERPVTFRYADGAAMLGHSLVKWFLDGWREAVGAEHERRVFAAAEQRLDAIAARDGSIAMTVPMLYLEAVAV